MTFSIKYGSFEKWLKAGDRATKYGRRIKRLHERFPDLTLKQLGGLKKTDYDLSDVPWYKLSPKNKSDRLQAVAVLKFMRKGADYHEALDDAKVADALAKKHLNKYLYKEGGKWQALPTDKLQVEMNIYDRNLGYTSIIVNSSEARSRIGKYSSHLEMAKRKKDSSLLDEFAFEPVVDIHGKKHYLVIDPEEIAAIEDSMKEGEILHPYGYVM